MYNCSFHVVGLGQHSARTGVRRGQSVIQAHGAQEPRGHDLRYRPRQVRTGVEEASRRRARRSPSSYGTVARWSAGSDSWFWRELKVGGRLGCWMMDVVVEGGKGGVQQVRAGRSR